MATIIEKYELIIQKFIDAQTSQIWVTIGLCIINVGWIFQLVGCSHDKSYFLGVIPLLPIVYYAIKTKQTLKSMKQ